MTKRQDLVNRTARRLLQSIGYAVYSRHGIHTALLEEGWKPSSDAAYNRIVGDVQRAARDIWTASLGPWVGNLNR